MNLPIHCSPLDPEYPPRLRSLHNPPASISVRGGAVRAERTVAVVGSRDATAEASAFARSLGCALARADVVVVSGGASGIDAAAHRGALEAGGRTWAVAGTGHRHCFPTGHADLFDLIGRGPGAMVWPFAPDFHHRSGFLTRNRVLVALADAVVVVQAGLASGALHAATWARKMNRPLWVVPATPWMNAFAGSCRLLEEGAHPLVSIEKLMSSLGLAPEYAHLGAATIQPRAAPLRSGRDGVDGTSHFHNECVILAAISTVSLHVDAIAARAGQGAQATSAALLTLALEDVVVEGPPGFFRRRDSCNR